MCFYQSKFKTHRFRPFHRGFGAFHLGMGFGPWGWCWCGGFPTVDEEEEIEWLEEYRKHLQEELAEVEKRISQLKSRRP